MSGLVDYAGLFPPAKLDMGPAAENYARYLMQDDSWMLGRIIVPVSRLDEFDTSASALMPGTYATSGYREHVDAGEPWRLSAIVDGDLDHSIERVCSFNERHSNEQYGLAPIDALELRASSAEQIDGAMDRMIEGLFPFFEIPVDADCRGLVAALAGGDCAAKIRCGGVTPDAFPTSEQIADFLLACGAADVSFKATAGLHHPIRSEYRLTYASDAPRGTMHGFVNVFIAAAMIRAKLIDRDAAIRMLEDRNAAAFSFTDKGVTWDGVMLESALLARSRESFAMSYGSCSFEEPTAEIAGLYSDQ